ncbi:MAG: arginine--tRNA ligase, partial [Bacteroidota bacterium]
MKEYLHRALTNALTSLHYPAIEAIFEKPKIAVHGDLTTNVAMLLAKPLGKNPRQVAEAIVSAMVLDPTRISSMEIAGPGFINFHFSDSYTIVSAKAILQEGNNFGRSSVGGGLKTNVEWVSANPTGPLHSGHGRQVILGATIANLLEWTGHAVTREYYFNNAGNQMRTLAESVYARYRQSLGDDYPFPSEGYQGDYIGEIALEIKNEKGDTLRETGPEKTYFKKKAEAWCFD